MKIEAFILYTQSIFQALQHHCWYSLVMKTRFYFPKTLFAPFFKNMGVHVANYLKKSSSDQISNLRLFFVAKASFTMPMTLLNVLSAPFNYKVLDNGFIEISDTFSQNQYFIYDDGMVDVMLQRVPKEMKQTLGYIKSAKESLEVLKSSATNYIAVSKICSFPFFFSSFPHCFFFQITQYEICGVTFSTVSQSMVPLFAYESYYHPNTTPAQKEIISFCIRAYKENQKGFGSLSYRS